MTRRRTLILVDTAASLAWLGMDACWLFDSVRPALVLAAAALGIALAGLCLAPPTRTSRLVSGAMTSWVVMNVLWMVHDLGLVTVDLLPSAKALFVLGAAMLCAALVLGRREAASAFANRLGAWRSHPKLLVLHRAVKRPMRRGTRRRRTPRLHAFG